MRLPVDDQWPKINWTDPYAAEVDLCLISERPRDVDQGFAVASRAGGSMSARHIDAVVRVPVHDQQH